jgi:hypothetical protein
VRIASVDEVGDVLAQRIEHALHRELSALGGRSLGAGTASTGAVDEPRGPVERARQGPQAASGDRAEPAGAAERVHGEQDRLSRAAPGDSLPARVALLVHYLETGALPWPLANLGTAAALAELRDAAVTDPLRVVGQLPVAPAGFRAQRALWFRWLQLVPEAMWPIVARGAVASGDAGARLVEIVAALSSEPAGWLSRHARLELAAAAIVLVREGTPVADPAELAAVVRSALGGAGAEPASEAASHDGSAARALPPGGAGRAGHFAIGADASGAAAAAVLAAAVLAARLPEPAATAFRHWLASPRRHDAGARPDAMDLATDVEAAREAVRHAAPSPAPPRVEPAPTAARATRPGNAPTAALFGQMVHHAGLVLLHPYLPRFFESTYVKQAGAPALLAGELPRAAALLHLVATGDPEPFELELDLIKLLIGLPLDAELPVSDGPLGPADREEVDALLGAVVEHWSALKRTSVQGLRVSFLQRHGLLREDAHGFRLQVEPAPFDMLLGQLPWGMAVVKLPWMTRPIFTDWPAP